MATRRNDRGFAMLLVMLMAGMIAISLYMEIPRFAMQKQRDKEQILIDRGEQYKRAIQLFVKKAGRFPAEIKDLESFQNQRFLRQRYLDPMTGKDEWRLIHIQGGMLTDSKVVKPQTPGQQTKDGGGGSTAGQFVGEQQAMGSSGQQQGGAPSFRDRRRPSENGNVPGGNMPGGNPNGGDTPIDPNTGLPVQQPVGQAGVNPNGQPMTGIPGGIPGQPGFTPMPGQPGVPNQFGQQPNMPGAINNMPQQGAGTTTTGGGSFVGSSGSYVGGSGSYVGGGAATGAQSGNPGQPSAQFPGQNQFPGQQFPGQPGPPANSQTFGGTPAYPINQGAQGQSPNFPQPGTTTTGQQPNNAAADMIRNILTTPRPGGMPTGNPGGQTFGAGIAGVASTAEGEGVKVYNDHSLYSEWEFIFDPAKQKQIPNPNGQLGVPGGSMGTPSNVPGQVGAPGFSAPPPAPGSGAVPGKQ